MTFEPLDESGIEVSIEGDRAVVQVIGDVDLATAPTLGGLLEALVDHGHTHIVLDLEAVTFLDASGLRVLARVLALLAPWRGRLSLWTVPADTRRLLEITGFAHLIETAPVAGEIQPVFETLPTTNLTVDAALRLVLALAAAAVRGADGVTVSLVHRDLMVTAAASDAEVLGLDRRQYESGEGPCLDAAAEGRWVRVDALDLEERWPHFVASAVGGGMASILSTPLLSGQGTRGTLNIYSRSEGAFGRAELELAAVFASHVSLLLVDASTYVAEDEWTSRMSAALLSRKLIAQVQGMLMEDRQISAEDASAILSAASRAAARTLDLRLAQA